MLDELQRQYFTSEEGFAAAMKLLQRYVNAYSIHKTFEEFQTEFLDQLDDVTDRQSELLAKALEYHQAKALTNGNEYIDKSVRNPEQSSLSLNDDLLKALTERLSSHSNTYDAINSVPIEQAMEEFINSKRLNWNSQGGMENVFRKECFPLLLEATMCRETDKLSKVDANLYREAVLRLPKNRRKMPAYRGMALSEILKNDIPESDKLGNSTRRGYLSNVANFFDWMGANGYCNKEISTPLRGVVKKASQIYNERDPFTKEELAKLFNSKEYTSGLHDAPFKYWVPLLLLLSGARANEICQLLTTDIIRDDQTNIWVLDINQTDSQRTLKSLKKPFHARRVPIHPFLIRLGFIEYIEFLTADGKERVFEELPYAGMKNKHAAKMERWFNNTYTNQKNCGVKSPKNSCHSLRHNLINALGHDVKAHEHEYAYALGQTPAGGVTTKRYLKPSELKALHALFSKVNFKNVIDFSLIKPWREQLFFRKWKRSAASRKTK